jgi:hypothetical protein
MANNDVDTKERSIRKMYDEVNYYFYFVHRLHQALNGNRVSDVTNISNEDDIIDVYDFKYQDSYDDIVNIIHNICFWYHSIQLWLKIIVGEYCKFDYYTILYSADVLQP